MNKKMQVVLMTPKNGNRVLYTAMPKGMQGDGFFTDLWKGIKDVGGFVKDNKLLSTGLNLAGKLGVPYAGTAGTVAGQLGLGKRKRRRTKQAGGRKNTIIVTGSTSGVPSIKLH